MESVQPREQLGDERWLTPGVGAIGTASLLADLGHEIPTALLPSFVTSTLGAPAAALGAIEGIADGLAGANLAASAIAGVLWTLASPRAAFVYLAAWMLLSLVALTLTRRQPDRI